MKNSALGEKVWQCWHRGRDNSKVHFDDTCFFLATAIRKSDKILTLARSLLQWPRVNLYFDHLGLQQLALPRLQGTRCLSEFSQRLCFALQL